MNLVKILTFLGLFASVILFNSCQEQEIVSGESEILSPQSKKKQAEESIEIPENSIDMAKIEAMVERINKGLLEKGVDLEIQSMYFFTIGKGVNPFVRLRTGRRWPFGNLSYIIDESDLTVDVPAPDAMSALISSYETWNMVENTNISLNRLPDTGENIDLLDKFAFLGFDSEGNPVYDIVFDLDYIGFQTGVFPANIVMGGWLPQEYFELGLGSASILGVTITLSSTVDPDPDGDGYVNPIVVEQYYNEAYQWVTQGSFFLGAPNDIETISLHENGHALGLDHFGGPVNDNQIIRFFRNGKLYNPDAVMNPFYLGGETRMLLPTDFAALSTLYSRN